MKRVLIVDDDPIVHELVGAFVSGIEPEEILMASNGRMAVEQLRMHRDEIELIFCDLHMPEMDGIELLTHLQRTQTKAKIAIVSSASDVVVRSAHDLARVYGLDIFAAVNKPIDFDKLSQSLAMALDQETRAA